MTAGPTLISPASGSVNVDPTPAFTWTSIVSAKVYQIQIATDAGFTNVLFDFAGIIGTTYRPPALLTNKTLYWRVRGVEFATDSYGSMSWATKQLGS